MTTEDELWVGHWDWGKEPMQKVRCACGGWLVAPLNDQLMIRLAVVRHQRSIGHRAWWKHAGWY